MRRRSQPSVARDAAATLSPRREVADEALVRVWRHAPVFDPRRSSVTTWVLTIARNLSIDELRKRRPLPTEAGELGALAGCDPRSEDTLATYAEAEALRGTFMTIPDEQRRALVLAAVYGFTAAEIAEREAIPLGTAKTRIRTGLQKLRAGLEDAHESYEGGEEER